MNRRLARAQALGSAVALIDYHLALDTFEGQGELWLGMEETTAVERAALRTGISWIIDALSAEQARIQGRSSVKQSQCPMRKRRNPSKIAPETP